MESFKGVEEGECNTWYELSRPLSPLTEVLSLSSQSVISKFHSFAQFALKGLLKFPFEVTEVL